ncbi:hypothetical protein BDV98DRAFT_602442 [Pterulicium gracile]|uniref:Uncharacterized protein n=1 Tax=Pterulicium gracile TaxID=1884261 RepID=A0A5C3QRE7_9AGAR|nr:hypothetical protein BDV98DRAFT_602442 [Pterula gracilis]
MFYENYVASGVPSLELNSVLATAVPIPSPEVTSGQLSLTEDDATPTFVTAATESEALSNSSFGVSTRPEIIVSSTGYPSQSLPNTTSSSEVFTAPRSDGPESSGRSSFPSPGPSSPPSSGLVSDPTTSFTPSISLFATQFPDSSFSSSAETPSSRATSETIFDTLGRSSSQTPSPISGSALPSSPPAPGPTSDGTIEPSLSIPAAPGPPPSPSPSIPDAQVGSPSAPAAIPSAPNSPSAVSSGESSASTACDRSKSSSANPSTTSIPTAGDGPIRSEAPVSSTPTSDSQTLPSDDSRVAGDLESDCADDTGECTPEPSRPATIPTNRVLTNPNPSSDDDALRSSDNTETPPLDGTPSPETSTTVTTDHDETHHPGPEQPRPRVESSTSTDSHRLTALTIIAALEGLALLLILGYYATSLRKRWIKRQAATRLAKSGGRGSLHEKHGGFAAAGLGGAFAANGARARDRSQSIPAPVTSPHADHPVASTSRHRAVYRHHSYTSNDTGSYSQEYTNADDPFQDSAGVAPTPYYRDGAVQTGQPTVSSSSTHSTNLLPITFRRSLTGSEIPRLQPSRSSLSTYDTSPEAYTRDPFDMEYNPMEADRPFGYRGRSSRTLASLDDDLYPSGPENSEVASSIMPAQGSSRPMSPSSGANTFGLKNPFVRGEG